MVGRSGGGGAPAVAKRREPDGAGASLPGARDIGPLDEVTSMLKEALGELSALRSDVDRLEKRNARLEGLLRESIDSDIEHRERVESRFDVVDDRLKRQDMMIENRNWEYDVAEPPEQAREYWNSIAGDDDRTDDAMKFLKAVAKCTTNMMRGQAGKMRVGVDFRGGDHRFPYHRAFRPHWTALVDAVEKYQYATKCEGNSYLGFQCVELPKPILKELARGLCNTHFRRLSLSRNHFGRDGIEFVMTYMRQNPLLRELRLKCNEMDRSQLEDFSTILREHPSLEKLSLIAVTGEELDGFELLRSIVTAGASKLKYLDLGGNMISTEGSALLSDFLATNPILNHLAMESNMLDDDDGAMIAAALKHNSNLRYLDLCDSHLMTEQGEVLLHKVEVLDPESLNSVACSNHTCEIVSDRVLSVNDRKIEPGRVRSCKIYNLLSRRNEHCLNVLHFDDIPVEILPEMLRSIHKHSKHDLTDHERYMGRVGYIHPLSLVYEVLRRWDKAMYIYGTLVRVSSVE
ncbi:hypothetical protein ACHAWF_012123 [Thalassiosira exigua]